MSRQGFRFAPPEVRLSAPVGWVLERAFAAEPPPSVPPAGAAALAAARRLSLSPRIAARLPPPRLAAELGAEAAAGFAEDRLAATAAEMALAQACRDVAAAAEGLGIPVAFLKFAALHLAGVLAPGSRQARDLDLLTPAGRGVELYRALVERGYRTCRPGDHRHHLPALAHPLSTLVEVHHHLPELAAAGGGPDATFERLAAAGGLEPAAGLGAASYLPRREVLAAHALAHGIAHHGWRPRSYPPMRMLADLTDLGLAGPDGEELLAAVRWWVGGSVSAEEARAAREACVRLVAGDPGGLVSGAGDAARLMRHILAGTLDDGYHRSLKIAALREALPRRARLSGALHLLRRALFLSRDQIDAIYGPPASPWGYLGRRLWRPFDLLARTLRAAASWWRLRRRKRSPRSGT